MRIRTLLPIAAVVGSCSVSAQVVWVDNFNGPAGRLPDPARWVHDVGGGGWGNRELQVYAADPANASLDGKGHLAIRAIRDQDGHLTSARLKTLGKFQIQYGRIEARIQMPFGQGLWAAVWMLGV